MLPFAVVAVAVVAVVVVAVAVVVVVVGGLSIVYYKKMY